MKKIDHVNLEKSSIMVRKNLEPSKAKTGKGPHKSHCIRLGMHDETDSLDGKDKHHLCLAREQIEQTHESIDLGICMFDTLI